MNPLISEKVQEGKEQRNQKKIPTPETEVGKTKLTIRWPLIYLNLTKTRKHT